jgi:hypothetical protein
MQRHRRSPESLQALVDISHPGAAPARQDQAGYLFDIHDWFDFLE